MNQPTNWMPGIVVLAGGVVVAVLYLLTSRQRAKTAVATAAPRDAKLEELEQNAQRLIDQLRELTAEKHQVSAEHFAAEKARLETEAAAALRAKDEYLKGTEPKPGKGGKRKTETRAPVAPTGFFARHPEWKGALWGGGVVLFFATLGVLLMQNERSRGEKDSATGTRPNEVAGLPDSPPANGAGSEPQMDPQLARALDDVKAHPENVAEAAAVGHELIGMRDFDTAYAITQRALGFDPFYVEHRIHMAGLKAARGEQAEARKELEHLADVFPDGQEAMLFLGMMGMQQNDPKLALDAFERYAATAPKEEMPEQLGPTIAMLRQQVGNK